MKSLHSKKWYNIWHKRRLRLIMFNVLRYTLIKRIKTTISKWTCSNEDLKLIKKKKLVCKKETYESLKKFIVIVIEINDAWYDFNLQRKVEKFELEKAKRFQKEFIKYCEERLVKE